jgi:hypothetical protein
VARAKAAPAERSGFWDFAGVLAFLAALVALALALAHVAVLFTGHRDAYWAALGAIPLYFIPRRFGYTCVATVALLLTGGEHGMWVPAIAVGIAEAWKQLYPLDAAR